MGSAEAVERGTCTQCARFWPDWEIVITSLSLKDKDVTVVEESFAKPVEDLERAGKGVAVTV